MMTNKVFFIFMIKQINVLLKASLMALFIRLLCECGGDDDDKEGFTFYDSANTSSSEKAPRRLCMSECWYFGIL